MYRAICGTYVNSSPARGPSSHPTPGRGERVPCTPQANAPVPAATSAGSYSVPTSRVRRKFTARPAAPGRAAPTGHPGSAPQRDRGACGPEPPGPPHRPVPRRPAGSRRLRRAAGHPVASLPWTASGNPAASLPGATEAEGEPRARRAAPGIPSAGGTGSGVTPPRESRKSQSQTWPARTGEPPGS
jgi:hypothetical protein